MERGKQNESDWREVGSVTDRILCVFNTQSVGHYVTLNMNSDWAPYSPTHNQYTDQPSEDYAYYVDF